MAGDGLMLCWRDVDHIARDAAEAPQLYAELALVLAGLPGAADGVRVRQAQPGLNLNPLVIEHRATIRHTLVSWCQLIAEERGITLPADYTPKLGRYIASHAQWLAAHPAAGECAGELHALVAKGRTLRQASGTRVIAIGPCPGSQGGQACSGTLRALLRREASLLPSEVACDADETHSWDSTQWTKLGRTMNGRAA